MIDLCGADRCRLLPNAVTGLGMAKVGKTDLVGQVGAWLLHLWQMADCQLTIRASDYQSARMLVQKSLIADHHDHYD